MKRFFSCLVLAMVVWGVVVGRVSAGGELWQYSTMGALMAGLYEGTMTCGALKTHGNFGLGTFDALDGEMIVADGVVYQARADGEVRAVADTETAPFAMLTALAPDRQEALPPAADLKSLGRMLDATLPSSNFFYAVRVEGRFSLIKARSVPRQSPPYPPLTEAVKGQKVFEWRNIEGTLIGFRSPEFSKEFCVPGYHFHFISADRQHAGHVLDLQADNLTARVADITTFRVELPTRGAFVRTALGADAAAGYGKAEK